MKARPLVLVEWLDSSSSNKWKRAEELVAEADTPMRCRSVGYVVARTKSQITLAAHVSGGHDMFGEHVSGDISIPNGCVVKVTRLAPAAPRR